MKLALFSSGLLAFVCLTYGEPKIDAEMDSYLGASPDLKSIIVSFYDTAAISNDHYNKSDIPRLLQENSATSQASTLKLLNARKALKASGSLYFQLRFINELIINDADMDLIQQLKQIPEVAEINIDKRFNFTPFDDHVPAATSNVSSLQNGLITWGVNDVEAPRLWKERGVTGRGVVVGIIDTGVLATHKDLAQGFRSQYGWFDAVNGRPTPYDDHEKGHGTHVIGTAVGRNGIGVAPGAKWIACKGLGQSSSQHSYLKKCMDFMLCPSNNTENCMQPKVVVNSWSSVRYSTEFNQGIDKWIKAGIIGIFSNGNNGPGCGSATSPGSYHKAIAVGNIDQNHRVASNSGRGPSNTGWFGILPGNIKPDISAPGSEVISASNKGNAEYATYSGTSMAAPHVAGVAALWSELFAKSNLTLTQEDVKSLATSTARPTNAIGGNCGNRPDSSYPNNHVGYGKITAYGPSRTSRSVL